MDPALLFKLLPEPVRRPVSRIFALLWCLLFGFGAVRLASEREWGYAAACAVLALSFLLLALFGPPPSRVPATRAPSANRPDPIE